MKLLLAEDEKAMSDAVAAILRHAGYDVDTAADGLAALTAAENNTYDCMIFDIMMPKMDGIEVLQKLRSKGDVTPVIMLTAKAEVDDRITGLDAGADDYLTKPFAMGELMARIRSMTRRKDDFTPTKLTAGSVQLDVEEAELSCKSSVRLSSKEAKLMKFFMLHAGKDVETGLLFSHVWPDDDDVDESIVWMYVSYLKEKLTAIAADITIAGTQDGPFTLVIKE